MNTRKLTTLAMLIALYIVLSVMTPVKIQNFKFTFEAFPILVAAILSGPLDGFIVGTAGSLIYQILFSGYGITPTTLLWVLPHSLSGLLAGFLAGKFKEHGFKECAIISICSALCVTAFNILALYVDSKLYGYYSKTLVFGNIIIKIIAGIILTIIYASVLPRLISFLKRQLSTGQ